MAGIDPLNVVRLGPWDGGWKPRKSNTLLAPNELERLDDGMIYPDGGIGLRGGWESEYDPSEECGSIHSVIVERTTGVWASPQVLVAAPVADGAGGGFYWRLFPTGSWAKSTVVDLYALGSGSFANATSCVSYGDAAYLTGRYADSTAKYTVAAGWAAVTRSVLDGTSSRFPSARALAVKDEHIFAGGIYDGTNELPHRLHWSNFADPETWDALDYIDVGSVKDGEITALAILGEDLVIFKETSVWVLTGKSEASWSLYRLTGSFGTDSQATVAEYDGVLYFHDVKKGLVAFDGSGFQTLTDELMGLPTEPVDNSYRLTLGGYGANFSVLAYQGKVIVSAQGIEGAVAQNRSVAYVYDIATGGLAWQSWGFGQTCIATDANRTNLTEAVFAVLVRYDGASYDGIQELYPQRGGVPTNLLLAGDNGDAVDLLMETGWYRLHPEGGQSRINRLRVLMTDVPIDSDARPDVTVTMYTDFDRAEVASITESLPATTVGTNPRYVEFSGFGGARFEWVKFRIEWSHARQAYSTRFLELEATVSHLSRKQGVDV